MPDRNPNDSQQGASCSNDELVRVEVPSKKSEQWLRSVVQNLLDVIIIIEADGTVCFVSPAVERVLGYKPDKMVGSKIFGYVHAQDLERVSESFSECLRTSGALPPIRFRVRTADGSWRTLEVVHGPIDDPTVQGIVLSARDVTDRIRAEERIRSQAGLLDAVGQAVIATDLGGRVLYWNRVAEAMYGWSAQEVVGSWLGEIAFSEDQGQRGAEIMAGFKAGRSWSGEFRVRRKDGTTFEVLGTDTPVHDEEGSLIGIIGFSTEITERKRAEETLRDSEARFRSLVQNASDIITILEEDATVRYVSPAVRTILGYEPEELVGKKALDFVHPDDLERTAEEFIQALSQPETHGKGVENRLRHKDGSWRYLYGIATNLLDDPAVRGLVINSRDVTERVRADEALRRSEERFRLLAENARDLIFRLRLKPTLGFEYLSPSATAMLGYTPEEHYADPELGLKTVLPEDRHLLEAAVHTPEAPLTLRWRRKDGQVIWTEQRSRPIYDEAGELVAVEGIVRDITDRKRVEEEKSWLADHLKLLLESTDEGIYGIDRQGRCTFVNQAAARILGYHPDELLGERMHQLVHHTRSDGSPYPEEECPIYRAFKENRGIRVDSEVLWRRDETPVPVEYSSSPIIKDGAVEGAMVAFVDITERKRAEDKLRESEERFRAQYKGFPLPTYSWRKVGEDFLLIDHNHAAYEFTRGRIVDFIGAKATQMYSDAPGLLDMVTRAFEEKTTVRREMPWRLLTTGEDKHLVVSMNFVPPDLVVMHTEDVTERVEGERKLKENEERFRLLAENAKDVIYRYRLKPAPGFEYVSPSVTAITGYTPEEHYADPELGLKIVHPDDRHLLEAFLGAAGSSDRVLTIRWLGKDGQLIWTEQRITLFYDASGDVIAMEGIGRDITERKEVEDALKRSEERFRSLVQNASDIIVILTEDGTVRYVSPAIERVLGFRTEEVVGKNAASFVAPVDRTKAIRMFAEAKREPGVGSRTELQLLHKDGAWRHLEINRNNLLDDPAVEGIVVNLRDVTDREVAEGQLRRRAFHDLLGGLQSRYLLSDTTQGQSSFQHRLNTEVPRCECAEILPGEDCGSPGTVWSEGKLLCEDHARWSESQDRSDLLRGIIGSLELCLDNVAVRRDVNFVGLLKAEIAHATTELELAQEEELRRGKR